MTNSRSPCLTFDPSSKLIFSKYPFTCERSSTDCVACVVPTNSIVSLTGFSSGLATVTVGGGGATNWMTCLQLGTNRHETAASIDTKILAAATLLDFALRGIGRCSTLM